MPSRNVLKIDMPNTYYHAYSRGVNKRTIFKEHEDYIKFLSLLKRYLSKQRKIRPGGGHYAHLYGKLELLSFCLMANHFHLCVFQEEAQTLQTLMRCVMTSYSRYFNEKYNRTGPLFESRYKAVILDTEQHFTHITRYIHLNPIKWREYKYSSLPYYLGQLQAEWVMPERVLDMFSGPVDYLSFLYDYEEERKALKQAKEEIEL